jgi:hypothetical protein
LGQGSFYLGQPRFYLSLSLRKASTPNLLSRIELLFPKQILNSFPRCCPVLSIHPNRIVVFSPSPMELASGFIAEDKIGFAAQKQQQK